MVLFDNGPAPTLTQSVEEDHTDQLNLADLADIARDIDKIAPNILDPSTRLDGAHIEGENTIVFEFTMINVPAEALSGIIRTELESEILQRACTSSDVRELLSMGVDVNHSYTSSDNVPIALVRINPDSCKEGAKGALTNQKSRPAQKPRRATARAQHRERPPVSGTRRDDCDRRYGQALSETNQLPMGQAGPALGSAMKQHSECLGAL